MGHARSVDKSDLLFLFQREVHTEHIEFLKQPPMTTIAIYFSYPASLPEKMPTGRFQTALSLYDVYMLISVVPFSSPFRILTIHFLRYKPFLLYDTPRYANRG